MKPLTVHPTVERAELVRCLMGKDLSRIADERMMEFRRWWRKKFPRCYMRVIFGMGSEVITIGDKTVYQEDDLRCTDEFFEAVGDVLNITQHYTLACPNDFKHVPRVEEVK